MFTSQFPHEHKLWDFSCQLPREPHLLRTAESGGINVDHVWGPDYENLEKPTLSLLNVDYHTRFEDLSPPFTYVVHDHGGHSPYGLKDEGWESTKEFFQENDLDRDALVDRYRDGAKSSAERFHSLYERLEDRSLLEDTLVVFTSDHGELLGEYGSLYEHTTPMVPETLEVPYVFCGAGLPTGEIDDERISGIDLTPTVLRAQDRTVPGSMRGRDLWSGSTETSRPIRADVWRHTRFGDRIKYAASSVWDDDGGVVVHRGSRLARAAFGIGTNYHIAHYSSLVRRRPVRNLARIVSAYVPKRVEYGSYAGECEPDDLLETTFEEQEGTEDVEVDRDHLEALGYVQ